MWLALAMALATRAATSPADLQWARRPNGADVQNAYPKAALAQRLTGRIVLNCVLTKTGKLQDCRAVSEEPQGWEFARGALKLSRAFRVTRASASLHEGETVELQINLIPPPKQ